MEEGNALLTKELIQEINGKAYMSSKDISRIFKKDIKNIHRDIDNMLKSLDGSKLTPSSVVPIKDNRGYNLEILLEESLAITLVSGFTGEYYINLRHSLAQLFIAWREGKLYSNDSPEIVHTKAGQLIRSNVETYLFLGVPKHRAQQEAVKSAKNLLGVDYTHILSLSVDQEDIPEEEISLEHTELAAHFGLPSPQAVNQALAAAGYQTKTGTRWLPTELGKSSCSNHSWASDHSTKSGYNLKWKLKSVEHILIAAKTSDKPTTKRTYKPRKPKEVQIPTVELLPVEGLFNAEQMN